MMQIDGRAALGCRALGRRRGCHLLARKTAFRRRDTLRVAVQAGQVIHAPTLYKLTGQMAEQAIQGHLQACLQRGPTSKYIVGIAGMPGSGKSTLAGEVVRRINAKQGRRAAVVVPMDGFHLYRKQLDEMPDPARAHARRGAPWTFDAAAYVACIRAIREQGRVLAPSFDHGVGDPVEDAIEVDDEHDIVVTEGNYLLLDQPPWSELPALFDESWFLYCATNVAMRRVFKRQTDQGLAPEVSTARIEGNDRPNALTVARTIQRAQYVLRTNANVWDDR